MEKHSLRWLAKRPSGAQMRKMRRNAKIAAGTWLEPARNRSRADVADAGRTHPVEGRGYSPAGPQAGAPKRPSGAQRKRRKAANLPLMDRPAAESPPRRRRSVDGDRHDDNGYFRERRTSAERYESSNWAGDYFGGRYQTEGQIAWTLQEPYSSMDEATDGMEYEERRSARHGERRGSPSFAGNSFAEEHPTGEKKRPSRSQRRNQRGEMMPEAGTDLGRDNHDRDDNAYATQTVAESYESSRWVARRQMERQASVDRKRRSADEIPTIERERGLSSENAVFSSLRGESSTRVMMTVISVHHPVRTVSPEQAELIQNQLLAKIDATPAGSTPPQFERSTFDGGILWMICSNLETQIWLRNTVWELTHQWEGSELMAVEAKDIPKRSKVIVWIPELIEVDAVKKRLRIQNPELRTDDWLHLNRKLEETGQMMAFSVDARSYAALERKSFRPFWGFATVQFKPV